MAAVVLRRLLPPGWALSGSRTLFMGTSLGANKNNKAGDSDPMQQLFLQKLNEYKAKKNKMGKIPDLSSAVEKQYQDDLERLKRIYGGGDLSKFPKFTFEEKSA